MLNSLNSPKPENAPTEQTITLQLTAQQAHELLDLVADTVCHEEYSIADEVITLLANQGITDGDES